MLPVFTMTANKVQRLITMPRTTEPPDPGAKKKQALLMFALVPSSSI